MYLFVWAAGATSAPKAEEVKRLPGGKIKKKVKVTRSFLFVAYTHFVHAAFKFLNESIRIEFSSNSFLRIRKKLLSKRLFVTNGNVSLQLKAWNFLVSYVLL